MSLLDELDESIEAIGEIADHLEAQMGRCERGRISLLTWITNRFEGPENSPRRHGIFPNCLLICAWIMQPGSTVSRRGSQLTRIPLSSPGVHLYSAWKCS